MSRAISTRSPRIPANGDGTQNIGDVASGEALPAVMPDEPDLMDRFAVEAKGPHPLGHQCLDLDFTPQSRDRDPTNA